MMYNYPFFGMPYYRNYHYSNNSLNKKNSLPPLDNKEVKNSAENESNYYCRNNSFFEIFGLKLYEDDILLISLIFFLYKEGVKDNYLLFALVLLLLS